MSEAEDDRQYEALILVGYASLMESVQNFEWALKRLAIQENEMPDDLSFDEAWKRAERVLRKPIGALTEHVPPELSAELPRLRTIRNRLAHEVLLRWRFETRLGMATHAEVVDTFVEIANEFDSFGSQLDALADEHLEDIGVDPADLSLSRAELRKILGNAGRQ